MSTEPLHPAIEIDPRRVARLERYLRAYARVHALDPLEHRRRVRAGERLLAAQRVRASVLDAIALARAEGRPFHAIDTRRTYWSGSCRVTNWR